MNSIYQELILDHYHNPRNWGVIQGSKDTYTVANPSCGDKLNLFITIKKGRVEKIQFTAEGCALSIASASILTEFAKKKSVDELRKLDKDGMIKLLGIEVGPNRLKCVLLSWEALIKIIG